MFRAKPRTYTRAEEVIETLAEAIISDNRGYKRIASDMGLAPSTVGKIARRETRWPRPNTFFAVLDHYGIELLMSDGKARRKRA